MPKPPEPAKRLKEITELPHCPGALLVLAPDEIRRERVISKIITTFMPAGTTSSLPIERYNLADFKKDDVRRLLDEVAATSLFAPKRFFILRNIDEIKAEILEPLYAIFKNPPDGNTLLLCGKKLPSNSRLLKLFSERDLALVLDVPKESEFLRWIEKELKTVGFKLFTPDVTEGIRVFSTALSEQEGRALCDVAYSVVERLSLYKEAESVTLADLKELFPEAAQVNEFSLVEALSRGDLANADLMFRELRRKGVNEFMLLGLIHRSWSSYLAISYLKSNGRSDAETSSALAMNSWLYGKYLSGVRGQVVGKLRHKLWQVLKTDSRLKNRSLAPENTFSSLFAELAS